MKKLHTSKQAVVVTTIVWVGSSCAEPQKWWEDLSPEEIGDAQRGAQLFRDKECEECHSFEGEGGSDAPALDFMTGRMSARDVADMTGTLWNHIPHMIPALEAEQIPYPAFEEGDMADLIAFLHGGTGGKDPDTAPAGHVGGADLPVEAIGDPTAGRRLFDEKQCSECHSYGGYGGTDAPPFDDMAGHLSAREVADMGGRVWNSFPMMLMHFEEEGVGVPTFAPGEAADLIAYLHGGPMP